jgi:hypothetical protein
MADKKKKLKVFGKEIDVTEIEIAKADEGSNHYALEDGSVLRVRHVVNSIVKVDDQTSPIGHPIYMVFSTPVTTVESWKDEAPNGATPR